MKKRPPLDPDPSAADLVSLGPPERVFTPEEKRDLTAQSFRHITLDGVDFTGAKMQDSLFHDVSLRRADFRGADLRGVQFLRCDLRGARLDEAFLGGNRFHGSCLASATGLTEEQRGYICRRGGSFADWGLGPHLGLIT